MIAFDGRTHQPNPTASERDLSIDRLRSVMTALVIFHHTAITYGAPGSWFWTQLKPSGAPSSRLLALFVSTNQAYFMGLFFLLAGSYTKSSTEIKDYARFILDRFVRLGLPLLAFGIVLGPATAGIVNYAEGNGFWVVFSYLWQHKQFIDGPLWFAQALLIFSLGYCLWRAAWVKAGRGATLGQAERKARPVPSGWWWLLSALAVGAASLEIRQFVPVGENVFRLQLGYFCRLLFLFAAGIRAWRNDWLWQLGWRNALVGIVASMVAWPLLPLSVALARKMGQPRQNFSGGFSWASIVYALWEPFVAWGLIALWLLASRTWINRPWGFLTWLSRRAYAVYILHPLVLVSLALLLHGWVAPALPKFVCDRGIAGLDPHLAVCRSARPSAGRQTGGLRVERGD
jgi:fucose 4-O-acetylase-like acetyltransferase